MFCTVRVAVNPYIHLGLSIWVFWYLLRFLQTGYHRSPRVTIPITIYVTIPLWKFCTILNKYHFQHISGVTECPPDRFLVR